MQLIKHFLELSWFSQPQWKRRIILPTVEMRKLSLREMQPSPLSQLVRHKLEARDFKLAFFLLP